MRIYDTKQGEKVSFEPVEQGKVSMYVCGPTVHNYIHIGNARTFISFDVIRRYLIWRGFDVKFVQNITDVDDKIIIRAQEEGCSTEEIARKYTQAFIDDMHAVGVLDPDVRPKATEEISTMLELIERLISQGHAYEAAGDVYFSVRSYSGYGQLSGRDVDEMEAGHRSLRSDGQGIEARKRDPLDFAVWKAAKPGEPFWESPWGKGRPGWHIECSAMAKKYLGQPIDIHGGGSDLVFPHHENERAQSEAACSCVFSKYWLHGGMLQINSEKMSKSLGNFKLLREVLEHTSPKVLRMLMLQTHYRSPLDFSDERLEEAATALERIENFLRTLSWLGESAQECESSLDEERLYSRIEEFNTKFIDAMDDDFNTAGALGELFAFIGDINPVLSCASVSKDKLEVLQQLQEALVSKMSVLGIELEESGEGFDYPEELLFLAQELSGYEGVDRKEACKRLLEARAYAREQKDWALADSVRDGILACGLRIEDTPQGARLVKE